MFKRKVKSVEKRGTCELLSVASCVNPIEILDTDLKHRSGISSSKPPRPVPCRGPGLDRSSEVVEPDYLLGLVRHRRTITCTL